MHNFYLTAQHFEIVRVSGPDAARFLQGQLTCDVAALAGSRYSHGAVCNNKGRVLSIFVIMPSGPDFILVFRTGLAALFVQALARYKPFYKCDMHLDNSLHCLGLAGPAAQAVLLQHFDVLPEQGEVGLSDTDMLSTLHAQQLWFLLCGTAKGIQTVQQALAISSSQDDGMLWQILGMQLGHYPFSAEDSEQHTPQDLHLDRRDYVSFSKGCYTGQEIVARMHYRGKPKKQFFLVKLDMPDQTLTGPLAVLDDEGKMLATCTKLARDKSGKLYALAQLPLAFGKDRELVSTNLGTQAELAPL